MTTSRTRKTGTTVTFTLSEAADVTFIAQRRTTGRRVGTRCVKTTRSNRRRKQCVRYVAVRGSFSVKGIQGSNRLRFTGRLRRKALKATRYRLVASANAGGRVSAPRTIAFRIRRR